MGAVLVLLLLCGVGFCSAGQNPYEKYYVFGPICVRNAFSFSALEKWCSNYAVCDWQGITCSGSKSQVSSIVLEGLQLNGTIPQEFSLLTTLTTLKLDSNKFSGSIPPQITQITSLTVLDLHDNQFTGTIPSFSASSLTQLDLSSNQLIGSIPQTLSSTNLQALSLQNNNLSSTIPEFLGSLPLRLLSLKGNQIHGTIPTVLGAPDVSSGMNNPLGLIDLSFCLLEGSIPSQIGNLQSLVTLGVANNKLSGNVPSQLGNLKFMTQLALENNMLTGTLPNELGSSERIQYLGLSGNLFSGTIPSDVGQLTDMSFLFIGGGNLTGTLPTSFLANSALQTLSLTNTNVHGTIPAGVSQLTNLQFLNLASNHFGGTLPNSMNQIASNLRQLHVQNNFFSGTLPTSLESVADLDCSNSYFDSTICGTKAVMSFGAPKRIVSFVDTNFAQGIVSGTVVVERADVETGLGVYVIYLGQNQQKIGSAIGSASGATGQSLISVTITNANVGSATQFLAYSATAPGFNEVGPVSYAVIDTIDTNECKTSNGGCEQICTNTVGSFVCSCGSGQQIDASGLNCIIASPSPSPSGVPADMLCGSEASAIEYPVVVESSGIIKSDCTCTGGIANFTFSQAPTSGTRLWAKAKCSTANTDSWFVGEYVWHLSNSNDYTWTQYVGPLPKSNVISFGSRESDCRFQYVYLGKLTPIDSWYKGCPSPSASPSPSQDPLRNIMCPSEGSIVAPMALQNGNLVVDCNGASCPSGGATFFATTPGNLWVLANCDSSSSSGSWYVDGHAWTLQYSSLGDTWQQYGYVSGSFTLQSDQPQCRVKLVFVGTQTPVLTYYTKNCLTPTATTSLTPSITRSSSRTPSNSRTPSATATVSASTSPSPSRTPSSSLQVPSSTRSLSATRSPSRTPSASVATSTTETTPEDDSGSSSSGSGAAAGIAVGAVGGALAVVAALVFCRRKKRTILPMKNGRTRVTGNSFQNELATFPTKNSASTIDTGVMATTTATLAPQDDKISTLASWNVQQDVQPTQPRLVVPASAMMYLYPSWESIPVSASSLLHERITVIIFPGVSKPVFVWVGDAAPKLSNDAYVVSGQTCLAKKNLSSGNVQVVHEGKEPENFWAMISEAQNSQ